MKLYISSAINYFSRNPGTLFLLDGLGAALTAFSLFFVLRHYYHYVGMPTDILAYLSAIGLVYCAYSMSAYFLLKSYWTHYLKIIAIGNVLYCLLTMGLVYAYHNELTGVGLTYFSGEILIIGSLVCLEFSVANKLSDKKTGELS